MRWRRSPGIVAGAVGLVLAAVLGAAAAEPTEQLKRQIDNVLDIVGDPALRAEDRAAERQRAVRTAAEEIFDFGETAKRSLGTHWQARTPVERAEFVKLFSDLLERSYVGRIELYSGERLAFLGHTIDGDLALVRTRVITAGGEMPVDYRMLKRGAEWRVYDVIIEGVSLVANYRSQFNRIIRTTSYEELVKRMRTRQSDFEEGTQPSGRS
jgi:phospholipid transport system substrate-binding protein